MCRAKSRPPNPEAIAHALMISEAAQGVITKESTWGRGRVRRAWPGPWLPRAPEHRARGDAGRLQPQFQRAHRAQLGVAVGQRHGDRVDLLALAARQGEPEAALGGLQVLAADRRQLGAPQGAGEAHQQQGAVAPAAQVVADRRQQPAQYGRGSGNLLARGLAAPVPQATGRVERTLPAPPRPCRPSRALPTGASAAVCWRWLFDPPSPCGARRQA